MSGLFLAALLAVAPLEGVSGVVYDDKNGNGVRDAGEAGLPGVAVSDGHDVVVTGPDGAYSLGPGARRYVFVVLPGDRRAAGAWYRPRHGVADFPLAPSAPGEAWRFAQISDTHVEPSNVGRLRSAFALAASRGVDMGIVSGDLVKDALRVDEATARAAFTLYVAEGAKAPFPLHPVIGNHDVFGIERQESLVPRTHPAYGKALYEETLGPRCYAFNRGRIHFLILDTIGIDDLWYYGLLDPDELEFIRNDLAHVPEGTTVVTAGHIPLRVGSLALGFSSEGPARTLLTVGGVTSYRHVVRNASALDALLKPYRWTLALQGHTHVAERLRMWDGAGATRYHTAPAVDRQSWAPGLSGIVVYGVKGDEIDDGEVIPID